MVAPKKPFSLIDELLAAQQRLDTPVARFSGGQSKASAGGTRPALESVYRDLIPLTAPKAGEQYAFEVELDACTGCKACVASCHSLNGLDDTETWRDVGLVVGGDALHPFQQTVTSACHHCADPACLNGCPVLAYEKDPATGIVHHLDDQCIGCQYCVLKCPYDVPKYSERLGIVRKCDLCHDRLAEGEAPACVQACPTQAIRIVTVHSFVNGRAAADTTSFLPAAPSPSYTQPTTRYVSRRAQPENLIAADAGVLRPQPPHWPLAVMLTLVPMAVGCFTLAALPSFLPMFKVTHWVTLNSVPLLRIGWIVGLLGLVTSVFHLGQPWRAWRIFLGWRRSWLSREALVFGAWMACASIALVRPVWVPAAAVLGLMGLFCSVMVYVDTRRTFWRMSQTAPRFFGAAVVLGSAIAFALEPHASVYGIALAVATLLKLAIEGRVLHPLDEDDETPTPARQTARLLDGPLRPVYALRVVAGLIGGGLLPFLILTGAAPGVMAFGALGLSLIGEGAERHLFFRAVDAPKMPGGPA